LLLDGVDSLAVVELAGSPSMSLDQDRQRQRRLDDEEAMCGDF
jgi:hypothetical protein